MKNQQVYNKKPQVQKEDESCQYSQFYQKKDRSRNKYKRQGTSNSYLNLLMDDSNKSSKFNMIDSLAPKIFCLRQQKIINETSNSSIKTSNSLIQASNNSMSYSNSSMSYSNSLMSQIKQLEFNVKINISKEPPKKKQHLNCKLSKLKNQITPVEQIWSKCIKQYLNDSQFVQIYRKNNFIYNQNKLKYGQTVIKYDGLMKKTNQNNQFTQQNIFSRAYFKLWQILSTGVFNCVQNKQCNIACLAEGPGGFIHALIDYRLKNNPQIKDNYFSITLKVDEQDFIKTGSRNDWQNPKSNTFFTKIQNQNYHLKLSYGQDQKGDLLKLNNINYFQKTLMNNKKAFLVTGDGGILCSTDQEFHYQQATNAKLFFAQILTALKIQQIKGVFILKIYDCYFQITKELIILLSLFYQKIQAIKPVTSRPGNSQKYLKCSGFKGMSLIQQTELQKLFLQWNQLQNESDYFKNKEYVLNVIKIKNKQLQDSVQNAIQSMNQILCKEQEKKLQQGLKLIQENHNQLKLIQKNIEERMIQQVNYAFGWCQFYAITSLKNKEQIKDKKNNNKNNHNKKFKNYQEI